MSKSLRGAGVSVGLASWVTIGNIDWLSSRKSPWMGKVKLSYKDPGVRPVGLKLVSPCRCLSRRVT